MTVYVDDVGIHADVHNHETGRIVSSAWSHLISDQLDPAELHEFATKTLGLRRSYFQSSHKLIDRDQREPSQDHYDLTAGKRKQAIAKGAVSVSAEDLAAIIRLKRTAHRLDQCGYTIAWRDDEWIVGLEWGQEAEDSPMAGAAAYGVGVSAWDAVEMALREVRVP
jgi:hypothetical protein